MENGFSQAPYIINNAQEWEERANEFFLSMGDFYIVGLDCEWVDSQNWLYKEQREEWRSATSRLRDSELDEIRIWNGSRGRVALLQLASKGGITLLIRLCFFDQLPSTLKRFLEDVRVIKVGVNIEVDAKKLFTDWDINMTSFVDLRNVVVRCPQFMEEYHKSGLGLKKLGNFLANYQSDENTNNTVRYSHWAAHELTQEQIEYARNDARMAVDGIIAFANKYMDDLKGDDQFFARLRQELSPHLNRPCSDNAMHILEKNKNVSCQENGVEKTAASRKAEERRRRRQEREIMDESGSDIEFDYERWKKSEKNRRTQMREGIERAVLFADQKGRDWAALDSALLAAAKDDDQEHDVRFDVRNEKGDPIFDVAMNLKKTK